jgi:alditol oxidase
MPTTGALTNWAGNITFGAERVLRPTSIPELQQIVRSAANIRALGTGHCFNRIADTAADLVGLAGLPPEIEIDTLDSTVTVAAGLRYAQIAEPLYAAGFALPNLASLPHISVAGAVATGTHGSGDANRSLAAQVAGVRIVGPEGDITDLNRKDDPDTFPGAVVSLGALGIVTSVVLDIVPTFDVAQQVYVGLPLDRLVDSFESIFPAAYSVSVFTNWRDDAAVWLKQRTDQANRPDQPRLGQSWLGAHPADRPLHPVPGMSATHSTEQLGVPGPWHRRLAHFRPEFTPSAGEELQSEFFLPRAAAPQAVEALRGLADRLAPVLLISEIRTIAADDLWLSPCYGRDTVTFHFTWIKDTPAVTPVLSAVEEQLMPLEARPHWGKVFTTAPQAVGALYERAGDFQRLLLDHDPGGKFRNPFVDAALSAV